MWPRKCLICNEQEVVSKLHRVMMETKRTCGMSIRPDLVPIYSICCVNVRVSPCKSKSLPARGCCSFRLIWSSFLSEPRFTQSSVTISISCSVHPTHRLQRGTVEEPKRGFLAQTNTRWVYMCLLFFSSNDSYYFTPLNERVKGLDEWRNTRLQ